MNDHPKPGEQVCEIKVVVIGDLAVGKSSLVLRFTANEFVRNHEITIGASFMTRAVRVDNKIIKFQIWDTAGHEKYRTLAPMYYRGATICIIVYDITSKNSFNSLNNWVKELKEKGSPNIQIAIVGNKIDLEDQREITTAMGKQVAEELDALFIETSAKADTRVTDLFVEIGKRIPKEVIQSKNTITSSDNSDTVQLKRLQLAAYNANSSSCC